MAPDAPARAARSGRALLALLAFVTALSMMSGPASAQVDLAPVREPHGVTGRTLVVPVLAGPDRAIARVALPDGRVIEAQILRFRDEPLSAGLSPMSVWLGVERRMTIADDQADPEALALLVARIPPETPHGDCWIDGRIRVRMHRPVAGRDLWILDRVAGAAVGGDAGWKSLAADALRHDPRERWRAAMLAGEMLEDLKAEQGEHPAITSWAQQEQELWRIAMVNLGRNAPALTEEALGRIVGSAQLPPGLRVPVWEPINGALADLRAILLSAGAGVMVEDRVHAWLVARRSVVCWIHSDTGDGAVQTPTVAILGLAPASVVATAQAFDAENIGGEAMTVALQPGMTSLVKPEEPREGGPVRMVRVQSSGEAIRVGAIDATHATPPGASIGPVFADLSMRNWLEQGGDRPALESGPGGATIWRQSRARGTTPAQWRMLIEAPENARARLWIGPEGRERAILRIEAMGVIEPEIGAAPLVIAQGVTPTGWWAILEFEQRALGGESALLALEILGEGGARWAWPRAMFPWQRLPARARIDLHRWDGVWSERAVIER